MTVERPQESGCRHGVRDENMLQITARLEPRRHCRRVVRRQRRILVSHGHVQNVDGVIQLAFRNLERMDAGNQPHQRAFEIAVVPVQHGDLFVVKAVRDAIDEKQAADEVAVRPIAQVGENQHRPVRRPAYPPMIGQRGHPISFPRA